MKAEVDECFLKPPENTPIVEIYILTFTIGKAFSFLLLIECYIHCDKTVKLH